MTKHPPAVQAFTATHYIEETLIKEGYVVVFNRSDFLGLLSQADVLKKGHNLVIDCLSEKKALQLTDPLDLALETMDESQEEALPVLDGQNYAGIVTYTGILRQCINMQKSIVNIHLESHHPDQRKENCDQSRQVFVQQLSHYMRNPIQVILSSLHMLKDSEGNIEKKVLLNSIYSSTRQLDKILCSLFEEHYPEL